MKKIIILFFIVGLSTQLFAKVTVKQVVGKWNYTIVLDESETSGVFVFFKKDGNLLGEVIDSDNQSTKLSKIELKENSILYFELQRETDAIKFTLKIENKKFKGIGSLDVAEFVIKGIKQK